MTIPPDRVEAAARLLARRSEMPEAEWHSFADEVEAILRVALPELANGTAWVAPMEATEEMLKAVWIVWDDDIRLSSAWATMRDAHLNKPKDEQSQ